MRFLKVSCADCEHCAVCSKQTRMYVNYCGGDHGRIIDRIRSARSECARRRGPTLNVRDIVGVTAGAA
jgi:hypothetical protein